MANWTTITPEMKSEYEKWLATRPPEIKALAARFNPWSLYHLKNDDGILGHRVVIAGFTEAGSHNRCEAPGHEHCYDSDKPLLIVRVLGLFNAVAFERAVKVDPAHVEPCDLPPDDELVGSADLTPEEIALPESVRDAIMLQRRDWLRPFGEVRPKLMEHYGPSSPRCCGCGEIPSRARRFPNGNTMKLVPVRYPPSACKRTPPCEGWTHELCVETCYKPGEEAK